MWGKGKDKMHIVTMDSEKTVAISQYVTLICIVKIILNMF